MKSFYFVLLILIVYFERINNIFPNNLPIDSEMTLLDDKLIYTNNNDIKITSVRDNSYDQTIPINSEITKGIKLIKIDESNFVLFGLSDDNNKFLYFEYSLLSSFTLKVRTKNFFPIQVHNNDYSIKLVSEKIFILSFVYNNKGYIYRLNLENSDYYPSTNNQKTAINNDYDLITTLECDSYDGETIFCIYSLTNRFLENDYYFYSFENINETYFLEKEIKLSSEKIAIPSLLKVEYKNEKKFLICGIEGSGDPTIYCKYMKIIENEIIEDKTYTILQAKGLSITVSFYRQKSFITLKRYNYSIFILFEYKSSNPDGIYPSLIICPIDLSMNFFISTISPALPLIDERGNKDILMNKDYYLLMIKSERDLTRETKIYKKDLFIKSEYKEIYQFNLNNKEEGFDLSFLTNINSAQNPLLFFSIDTKTDLSVSNTRTFGGLLNQFNVSSLSPKKITLNYNKNLENTENYFIFLDKSSDKEYNVYSYFYFFRVINCYDGCNTCNINEKGTEKRQLCDSCLNNRGYYNIETSELFFNCYHKDDINNIIGYYREGNSFKKCHNSCQTCRGPDTCDTCKEGFYFKEDSIIKIDDEDSLNEHCYNEPIKKYYLNYSSNINYNDQIINIAYKKCYFTCSECYGDGNEVNNMCFECNTPYKKYDYDKTKCTTDIDFCLQSQSKKWRLNDTKNIECVDSCLSSEYVINEGINKGQCVTNCQSYLNPFSIEQQTSLLYYSCKLDQISYQYCITSNFCKIKSFFIDGTTCKYYDDTCIDMEDFTPRTEIDINVGSNFNEINGKVNIIKYFDYNNKPYSSINNFKINLANLYNNELIKEFQTNSERYKGGFNFITVSKFQDFTLIIYPLETEEYIYNNVIESNVFNFANFTQLFIDSKYEIINENEIILIGFVEHKNNNTPINSLNYFFFLYDEENKKLKVEITIDQLIRESSNLKLEIKYPLYNFENPKIKDIFSKNLLSSIKKFNLLDPNSNFYSKNEALFNDICYTFVSEGKTDVTIEDRLIEYYIGINFCENNCTLIKIFNKEIQHPTSLCKCDLKTNFDVEDENYSFEQKNIKKKVSNIKALGCAKEVFSKKRIVNNPAFWIFLLFLFMLIFFLLFVFFCGKQEIRNKLRIEKEDTIAQQNININELFNKMEKEEIEKFENKKYKSLKIESNIESSIKDVESNDRKAFQTSIVQPESEPPKRKKKNEILVILKQSNLFFKKENSKTDREKNKKDINEPQNENLTNSRLLKNKIIFSSGNEVCKNYWNYFICKGLYLKFFNNNDNLSLIIRIPVFIFILSFNLMINCIFLREKDIIEIVLYSKLNMEFKEFIYIFENEFSKCIYISFITILTQIIILKIINAIFSPNNYNQIKDDELYHKNDEYVKKYKNKSIQYIIFIIIFISLFNFISIIYFDIFIKARKIIFYRFIISIIMTYFIQSFIYFIISQIYFKGKNKKNWVNFNY